MCGRFVLFTTDESLLSCVGQLPGIKEVHAPAGTPGPRFNLAPTQVVPLVRIDAAVANVEPSRWGLYPHWKKDETGPPLFNARGETVATKPSFRDAFTSQRGLIPMDGYYEWHDGGQGKTAHYVSLGEGNIMWAAALWATGLGRLSSTIVTTAATEPLSWLHNRLPRLLTDNEIEQWTQGSARQAAELLAPTPADYLDRLVVRPVGRAVGNVANDYPELLD
ncbi:SOS response-associated peptidase [Corynebacterium alimapuense]|uniref:Abasic site processing protein n=1 Tax=Corynebacterium alimapuense TaxID=1576874 RepID=A0A3M8K6J0_9CORY|nr:SOS response-associated peptidase [Corynebacterium alimapuense]RNE48740.1 DUF159 family protein [Corynebacterium alimapuense]